MKILRISTYPTSLYPGIGLHPYHLSLASKNRIYYIHPKMEGLEFPNHDIVKIPLNINMTPRIQYSGIGQIFFLIRRLTDIFKIFFVSVFYLHSKKIDIVHIHSPMYLLSALYFLLWNKKAFITYHGSDFQRIKSSKIYSLFAKKLDRAFYLGPHMKDGLTKIHGIDKVTEVFNGVDLDNYNDQSLARPNNSICAVGALKPEKNFEFLLEAMQKTKHPFELKIAGRGPLEKKISELCTKNIELLGHLNQKDTIKLFNSNRIFVLSSKSEGFPKVLLEAIACGCRVITTDVGATGLVVGPNYPYLIKSSDPVILAEFIDKIYEDDEFDFEQFKNLTLAQFSWEKSLTPYQLFLE